MLNASNHRRSFVQHPRQTRTNFLPNCIGGFDGMIIEQRNRAHCIAIDCRFHDHPMLLWNIASHIGDQSGEMTITICPIEQHLGEVEQPP